MRILLKEDRVYLISKPILQWWSEQIKQPITILSQQGSFWYGFSGTHQFSEKDSRTHQFLRNTIKFHILTQKVFQTKYFFLDKRHQTHQF